MADQQMIILLLIAIIMASLLVDYIWTKASAIWKRVGRTAHINNSKFALHNAVSSAACKKFTRNQVVYSKSTTRTA